MKIQARELYASGLNLSQVAKELGVSASTVSDWKAQMNDWDDYRMLRVIGDGDELARININHLTKKFNELLKKPSLDEVEVKEFEYFCKLSDSYAKAINANIRLMPKVNEYEVKLKAYDEILGLVEQYSPEIKEKLISILGE